MGAEACLPNSMPRAIEKGALRKSLTPRTMENFPATHGTATRRKPFAPERTICSDFAHVDASNYRHHVNAEFFLANQT